MERQGDVLLNNIICNDAVSLLNTRDWETHRPALAAAAELPARLHPCPNLPAAWLIAGYRETLGDNAEDALYDGFETFLAERGWKAAQAGAAACMRHAAHPSSSQPSITLGGAF